MKIIKKIVAMQNSKLEYHGLRKEEEGLREALCTLGNGYFATRGAAEESEADGTHYPGTYLAGGYNRLKSQIAGKTIENEDLVNWPNWLHLSFRLEGDKNWFQLEKLQVLNYVQELDISAGILRREMHFIDEQQRETRIISTRLVSMDNPHLAAIKWDFVPVNWSGMVEVRSTLDGSTKNEGVKRYKPLKNQHLKIIKKGEAENAIYILVQTNQSLLYMAQAAKCVIFSKTQKLDVIRKFFRGKEVIGEIFTFHVTLGEQVSIEKTVSLFTSKDDAISEPLNDALKQVNGQADFSVVKEDILKPGKDCGTSLIFSSMHRETLSSSSDYIFFICFKRLLNLPLVGMLDYRREVGMERLIVAIFSGMSYSYSQFLITAYLTLPVPCSSIDINA